LYNYYLLRLLFILIKRIKIKSHYGYPQPQGIQTTNGLPSSFQNQIANNYINNNYINQMPPMNLQNTISGNSNADNNITIKFYYERQFSITTSYNTNNG